MGTTHSDDVAAATPMKPRPHEPATADLLQLALAQAQQARRRRNAARALGHLGPLARHTVYDLAASALGDPDPDVRYECVRALARLGPVATSAIPHLAAALRDLSPRVRAEAAVTLTSIWNAMTGPREEVLGRR
jgi:HEAT repeat protein